MVLCTWFIITALAIGHGHCRDVSRKVMVISAEMDGQTKPGSSSTLNELRTALNLRIPSTVTRKTTANFDPGDPDLGQELSETISYIDKIEKENMKFLDTIDEAGLVSNLRSQTEFGSADLANRTLTNAHLAASEFLLKNQRNRNRKAHAQAHRGMVEAVKLSNDYMTSSALDTADRVQNARHESYASRARANADVRDQVLDQRGKRYESRIRQRTRLRNALQAARADLRASMRKSNAAIDATEREDQIKRRIERINQAAKAREAFAAILTNKDTDELDE